MQNVLLGVCVVFDVTHEYATRSLIMARGKLIFCSCLLQISLTNFYRITFFTGQRAVRAFSKYNDAISHFYLTALGSKLDSKHSIITKTLSSSKCVSGATILLCVYLKHYWKCMEG